jgi:hypothetical protein
MKQYINRIYTIAVIGLVGIYLGSACVPEPTETPAEDPGPILTSVVQTVNAETTRLAGNRVNNPESQNASIQQKTIVIQPASEEPHQQQSPDPNPGPDRALLVSQTPERDAQLSPGTQFEFVWNVKNIGSKDWTKDYKVVFFSGDRIGTGLPLQYRLAEVVKPDETIQISIKAITGTTQGEFRTIWVLTNGQGRYFYPLNGRIKVGKFSKP